jgi:hypothetical protein
MTEINYDGGDASLTELFEILNHEYRRHILWVLAHPEARTDATVGVDRFAETDGDPDILRLALRHNHLPKLDDHGLVDWDPEAETLARGPRFGQIEPLLALMEEGEDEIPQNWP